MKKSNVAGIFDNFQSSVFLRTLFYDLMGFLQGTSKTQNTNSSDNNEFSRSQLREAQEWASVTNPALGKLKVLHGRKVVILTDLKNMADYQNVENIFYANILFFALKLRLTVLRQQMSYQIPKYMEQVKRWSWQRKTKKNLERPR